MPHAHPGLLPPPVLVGLNLPGSAHFIPTKAAPIRPSRLPGPLSPTAETLNPTQPSIAQQSKASTTLVGQQPPVACSGHDWTASTALARMQLTTRAAACAGLGPFPRPAPTVLPMVRFVPPTPSGHGTLHNSDSDLMHRQYRLSLLQWNPGPARKNPTQIVPVVCGRFHVVILQEAGDHAPLVSDQFVAYTGGTDLATLLNRNTFEPDAVVAVVNESPTGKDMGDGCTGCPWTCAAHLSRVLSRSHSALSTFTMSRPKSETPRPLFSKPYTRTCCSTMSTSSGLT